jgi:hypothetical protein
MTQLRELALYHPLAMKTNGSWFKSLLPFFDGIVLIRRSPSDQLGCLVDSDEVGELIERELVEVFDVGALTEATVAAAMRDALADGVTRNVLDDIGGDETFYYGQRIYWTLNGPEPSIDMMDMRNELMQQVGVGAAVREPGIEGPKVSVHARVWAPVLTLAPHVLRKGGFARGLDLQPVTDRQLSAVALRRVLELEGMPTAGSSVALELEPVVLDLRDVPIDEVVAFRDEHGESFRAYARALREVVRECGALEPPARDSRLAEHRERLADEAHALRRLARGFVGHGLPAFGLGIVGAGWREADTAVAPLGRLAELAGTNSIGPGERISHSYVFGAQPRLGFE